MSLGLRRSGCIKDDDHLDPCAKEQRSSAMRTLACTVQEPASAHRCRQPRPCDSAPLNALDARFCAAHRTARVGAKLTAECSVAQHLIDQRLTCSGQVSGNKVYCTFRPLVDDWCYQRAIHTGQQRKRRLAVDMPAALHAPLYASTRTSPFRIALRSCSRRISAGLGQPAAARPHEDARTLSALPPPPGVALHERARARVLWRLV